MKTSSVYRAVGSAVAMILAAQAAGAAEVWLQARAMTFTPPNGGAAVPMWGYVACPGGFANCPAATASLAWQPGPVLNVADSTLTVHLDNQLAVPTSLVIPALGGGALPARTASSAPLTSLAPVQANAGASETYAFTNVRPGTYLYHSGTDPKTQVQMGLYGAVAAAYPSTAPFASHQDQVLLFSEIDPALHAGVGAAANLLNYAPRYFLVNGKPDSTGGLAPLTATAGTPTLLRLVNAGIQDRAPQLLGSHFTVVGEDGNARPAAQAPQLYNTLLAAGRTQDISVTAAAAGAYPLYDRRMALVDDTATGGGMRTVLNVTGAAPTVVAQGDGYDVVIGQTLTVAAPGVLANDTGTNLTAALVSGSGPAAGTLAFSANGSFTYTMPSGGATGTQSFQYTASNGTETSVPATVSINVTPPPNQAPVGIADTFFVAENSAGNAVKTVNLSPSVLANDTDPDASSSLLSVPAGSVTALSPAVIVGTATGSATVSSAGTVTFNFPYSWLGDSSFTYQAQDAGTPPLSSAATSVRVVRDFRVSSVVNLLAPNVMNVRGFQRSLPVAVTYELIAGPGCPVAAGTVLDTATVAAGATDIGTPLTTGTGDSRTLRWTASNFAGRAGCQDVVVRATVPASGSTAGHATSVAVPLALGLYANP